MHQTSLRTRLTATRPAAARCTGSAWASLSAPCRSYTSLMACVQASTARQAVDAPGRAHLHCPRRPPSWRCILALRPCSEAACDGRVEMAMFLKQRHTCLRSADGQYSGLFPRSGCFRPRTRSGTKQTPAPDPGSSWLAQECRFRDSRKLNSPIGGRL
jgi:hypothetical protein